MSGKKLLTAIYWLIAILICILLITTSLSWIASGFSGLLDWATYFGFTMLSVAVLAAGWFLLARSVRLPHWLLGLTIAAALFRLGVGVVWFTVLPKYGYDSPSELNGYVMSDAYKRDTTAWELGTSEKRLLAAYGGKSRSADQYGGLLFLSAGLYRLLGGESHPRLGIVAFTAAFSALAVPFAWAFSRWGWANGSKGNNASKDGQTFEFDIAALSAWGLALYPEAVLQGSTQMREGFLITLTVAAFFGLAYYHQKHSLTGPAWILTSVLLAAYLSPPTAGLLLASLGVTVIVWGGILDNRFLRQPWFWIGAGLLLVVVVAGSFFTLERLTNQSFGNPLEMLSWWFQKTAAYQAHLSERASGWIQNIFRTTPGWLHTPLLISYGIVQPFLPAAFIDITAALTWRLIAIWRAAGWFLLLPFLLYAPLRAFTRKNNDRLAIALSVISWSVILLAAFRAGADPWDNVRYRAAFAGLQVALASWAWVSYRLTPDAWFKRAVILVISILVWFVPWYLKRYIHINWPVNSPFITLGFGLVTATILIILDWIKDRKAK